MMRMRAGAPEATLERRPVDPNTASDLLWESYRKGEPAPQELRGALDIDSALTVQLAILDRRLEAGAELAGWKIGLTSERVRQRFDTTRQPFGHLLAAGVHQSGDQVKREGFRGGTGVEPELCWTLASPLEGPNATPEDARKAAGAVSAGMEINELRVADAKDFPLLIADNLAQWGIVVGETVSPVPADFDSNRVDARIDCDGALQSEDRGADVIDDHFRSLAVLANELAPFGRRIEAGHRVITGSFSNHRVQQAGVWDASFTEVGRVGIRFV